MPSSKRRVSATEKPESMFSAAARSLTLGGPERRPARLRGARAVTVLAMAFPAKLSVGVMLPMLIVGDVFAATYYRRKPQWRIIWRVTPPAVIGIVIGFFVMKALGARRSQIMGVFLTQGVIVGLLGTLSGLGTGMLLLRFRMHQQPLDFSGPQCNACVHCSHDGSQGGGKERKNGNPLQR